MAQNGKNCKKWKKRDKTWQEILKWQKWHNEK
jgi:hypothetical protein